MKKISERLRNYEIPLTALKDGEAGIIVSISGGGMVKDGDLRRDLQI